ncbi:MAG: phosphotransferase [Acidimicrobiales bacterium]|nr:phosphotransferase [Acidimicrobiales bacterium]
MIPRHPDDISASWLTEALQAAAPGVAVDDVAVERVVDATNVNATIAVRHDAPDRLPNRLFVKLPPLDPQRRQRLDWASMGAREVRFYREMATDIGLQAPAAFVAEVDDASGEFVLVLEHLGEAGTRLPDLVGGLDPALLADAVRDLAELHARFEDPSARARSAAWLAPSGRTSDYGARLLREGIDSGARLGAAFVAVAERYIADRDLLQDAWELGPATVLHGDAHIGNVFVDERVDPARLGFYDFGLMTIGSPMRDVSYLIAMTLSPADRRSTERALIDEYLDARTALGAAPIDPDDAWFWHRLQAAYTVVASCQSIVARPTDSPGRRAFSAAFVDRAEQAVDDLDTVDAIERFAAG